MHQLKWLTLWIVVVLGLMACNDNSGSAIVIPPDTTRPVVRSTSPAGGATDVTISSAVTVTFSEAMKATSLTPATFYIEGVSGTVAVSADKRSATFTPASPLASSTTYTATITTDAKDSAGNGLASNMTWRFTTAPDTTPPQVVSVTPVSGSGSNQASTTTISVTFNEALNCATVSTLNVSLNEGLTPVPIEVGCSGNTITLSPTNSMPTDTNLKAVVESSVTDLAGNALGSAYSWSFGMAPWTRQFGTPSTDYAQVITSDGSGNLYVAGSTKGALDGQANAGGWDLFLTKYDANGAKQWTHELGTGTDDYASALISDNNGNLYVAGRTLGALDGQTNAGMYDLFVIKYDTNGTKQWIRQLGTAGSDMAFALTSDGAGNIYVAGATNDALDGQTNAGGMDLFVTKVDANGNKQWTRELGTAADDDAYAITSDGAGNIYVAGRSFGALNGQTNAGGADLFVIKYDTNGNQQWIKELGTAVNDYAYALTTDGAGNVYVAGKTTGALDGQTNAGLTDLFVTKVDANGTQQWTREFGTSGDDTAYALTSDGTGNIYVAGYTSGTLDGQTYAGNDDLFVTKVDANGTLQWTRELGTSELDHANALTSDSAGNIYAAGITWGALDGQTNAGDFDSFVVKYQSDGRKR